MMVGIAKSSILLTICQLILANQIYSQTSFDFHSLVDRNPLIIVESDDLLSIIQEVKTLDIAKNQRWAELTKLAIHPEFGFLTSSSLDFLESLESRLVDSIRPTDFLFSAKFKNGKIDWKFLFRSRSADLDAEIADLFDELGVLRDANVDDFVKKTRVGKTVQVCQVDDLNICWFIYADSVVVTSSLAEAKSSIAILEKSGKPVRSIRDSRRYLSIANKVLQRTASGRNANASLSIQFSPALSSLFFGFLDDDQQRSWGLNEIVGVGLSLNIFDSETREGSGELIINGFVKSTEPRVGVMNSIRLKKMPLEMPDLPGSKTMFAIVNFDYQHFNNERERLYDSANGDGAYSEYLNGRSRVSKLLGDEHRNNYAKSSGDSHGICWYFEEDRMKSCKFSSVADQDLFIQTIKNMSKKVATISSTLGYLKSDIEGFDAMLSKPGGYAGGSRLGFLFKEDWVTMGDESLLRQIATTELSASPTEVEELVIDLQRYVVFENGCSIVVAVWPGFWDVLRVTSIAKRLRKNIESQLENHTDKDFSKLLAEQKRILENFDSFESDTPKDKKECIEIATFTLSRIFFESFGKAVFLAGDEKTGFRFALKTYSSKNAE